MVDVRSLRDLANGRLWNLWVAIKQSLGAGGDADVSRLLPSKGSVVSVTTGGANRPNNEPIYKLGYRDVKAAAQAYADESASWLNAYRNLAGQDARLDEDAAAIGSRFSIVSAKGYTVGALTLFERVVRGAEDTAAEVERRAKPVAGGLALAALALLLVVVLARR